ncbi:Protein AF-10 ALL1-fused gene from chromosome 10 protein [Triplophysa tibetana]|uniref:Protein AF-10 ALL1-fused gene from chromosome 10 protein n=1 Tax=Triplophysa tibetana TaxID=1572043 RepID=A0A5A9N745_9TELE|nr:Protein AF-10 ALL1-fused gene from chromosome 10 protein [Triplophysa tibetana]
MVSSELYLPEEDDDSASTMKEMIGGCCVCSDERGWAENPLVYCDGHGCNVAVHQACYGIVQVPTGPWFCRKCESQERAARVIKGWRGRKPSWQISEEGGLSTTCNKEEEDSRLSRSLKTLNIVRCELCPHKDGALKRTDNGGWAHVVCALYIPEVEFANVSTMEPIVLQSVPHERYNKTCYICEEQGRESKAATGACMTCNKHGCRQAFHVTCAQFAGLLCEEQGSDADNVKYCGYCKYHYSKLKHKERDRHKPKHKKALELSPSLVPALMLSSEKSYNSSSGGSVSSMSSAQKRLDDSGGRFTNANFQEVPSHSSSSSKDGGSSDGKSSEGKTKKSSSHGTGSSSGSRGRKSVPGKPHGPVVTTATSSTVPSSSSPFQQGLDESQEEYEWSVCAIRLSSGWLPLLWSLCESALQWVASPMCLLLGSSTKSVSSGSVVQPTSDFLSFSDATLRTSESYTPSFGRSLVKSGSEGGASEGMVGLSTFSMLSQSSSSGKHYENCHPVGELGGLTAASYKRPQPSSSSSSATSSSSTGEDGVKKKKRGNWKNRYGPCYTSQDGKTTDTGEHGATLPLSTSPSPSSMSTLGGRGSAVSSTGGVGTGGAGSSSLGIQKSPSLLRNGSLQSMTVSSPPAGPGSYSSSSDVACPVPSAVLGVSLSGSNSDPVPTHQSVVTSISMPTLNSLPPAAQFTSTSSTHSSLLPGSFNLAQSHMFGNRLNPNSAMAALIAQSESSPAEAGRWEPPWGTQSRGEGKNGQLVKEGGRERGSVCMRERERARAGERGDSVTHSVVSVCKLSYQRELFSPKMDFKEGDLTSAERIKTPVVVYPRLLWHAGSLSTAFYLPFRSGTGGRSSRLFQKRKLTKGKPLPSVSPIYIPELEFPSSRLRDFTLSPLHLPPTPFPSPSHSRYVPPSRSSSKQQALLTLSCCPDCSCRPPRRNYPRDRFTLARKPLMSPLSGLHIRYDSSGPLGSGHGSGTDSLPPVATSIDQLLERQWNEGQQFLLQQGSQEDVLGMLKSLHQLQVENRRLEEQIRTLTMKKERLQLLSAQLSVPFTPTSTTATTASSPLYPGNTHTDMLHSKNIQLGSSVLTDSSQPLPSQDPLSGGHSSGSSTSSLSTPPSAAHSPPQQQVNGAGVAVQPGNANSSLPPIAGVTGLMGALQGNHLTMSGNVGTLNGVIQSSPSLTQNTSSLTTHPSITSASLPNSLNNSAARFMTEHHRQILLHQHQQQLQQIFNSQQPTHEQQQVLLYQLVQQQKQQQQQQNDVQLPINSLLPGNQPTISNNPFLAMHENNASKTGNPFLSMTPRDLPTVPTQLRVPLLWEQQALLSPQLHQAVHTTDHPLTFDLSTPA